MLAGNAPVRNSQELARVLSIPRRVWTDEQKEALRRWLTPQLLNERGLAEWNAAHRLPPLEREARLEELKILLREDQAVALYESAHVRGFWWPATVGTGKTLYFLLLGVVVPGIQRPMVLVPPGSAYDKTIKEFDELAVYWKVPKGYPVLPRVETYNKLGLVQYVDLLENFAPDLIGCDESDLLKNPDAACTRVFNAYMHKHPHTVVCKATGTPWRKSIKDYAHHLAWTLKLNSPVPLTWVDREEWSQALDLSTRNGERRRAGALWQLYDPAKDGEHLGEIEAVRAGYRRRIWETPGVLISAKRSCEQPLTVRLLRAYDDPILDQAFYDFRKTRMTQDGWPLSDPMSVLRHGTEIGCGFYYRWNPRPPKDWLDARKNWAAFVREQCDETQGTEHPLNSEKAVAIAHKNHAITRAWQAIRKSFIPNQEAVWLTLTPLVYAAEWLKLNSPAIVWVIHTAVGERLSEMTGLPFYSEGGRDRFGNSVLEADKRRSMILSVGANKRALNMQAWNRMFYLGWPQASPLIEQSMGRIHRQGQKQAVTVDALVSCAENLYSIESSLSEAEFGDEIGGIKQGILHANFVWTYDPVASIAHLPADDYRRSRWVR
jgi:hypothetical protein